MAMSGVLSVVDSTDPGAPDPFGFPASDSDWHDFSYAYTVGSYLSTPVGWSAAVIDGSTPLTAVSCGPSGFCVAGDSAGRVFTAQAS